MEFLAIPAVLVLGLFLVVTRTRATAKRTAPLQQIYERRLLSICGGDKSAMRRLVNEEAKRAPGVARYGLTKRALERARASRG